MILSLMKIKLEKTGNWMTLIGRLAPISSKKITQQFGLMLLTALEHEGGQKW